MTTLDVLKKRILALPYPENYYRGIRLPEDFELPNEILLFCHRHCAQTLSPTAHYRYTLIFPLGEMVYYVGPKKYSMREGDVLFIPPYSLRLMAPNSSVQQRFFITFQLQHEQSYTPTGDKLCSLNDAGKKILYRILEHYRSGSGIELAMALYEFLHMLIPDDEGRNAADKSGLSREIAKALEFINDNLHHQLEIKQIASKIFMSTSNTAQRFRREVGMPIHQYILHQRLEFACYYLRETKMRLDEIAKQCSFESPSSFSHFFKSKTGKSPMAWRNANRQKVMNEES